MIKPRATLMNTFRMLLKNVVWVLLLVWGQGAIAQSGGASSVSTAPIPIERQGTNAAIIPIRGPIDMSSGGISVMATSVSRRIRTAVAAGADTLIFDIDTPGGAGLATLQICQAIRQSEVKNTIAWINSNALSAGAIIALSCKHIVVNDPVSFGDAMPIGISGAGATTFSDVELRRKVLPPLIQEILTSARRHNDDAGRYVRDEYLLMSIVANDVELWWVRNKQSGESVAIDRSEFEMLFPNESGQGATRLAKIPGQPASVGDSQFVKPGEGAPVGSSKLAGVVPELNQLGSLVRQSTRPQFAPDQAGQWELVTKITDGSAPAIFSAEDLLFFGLAANDTVVDPATSARRLVPVRTEQDLIKFTGATNVRTLNPTWTDGLVVFLTNNVIRGILIAILLLAIFGEILHPGATVPGLVAVGCLFLLLAPPMIIGLASWLEIGAILIGILLIVVEILVIPGFGVAGILGVLLLFGGLIATFVPSGSGLFPASQQSASSLMWGLITVISAAFSAGVGIYFISKNLASVPFLNRLVLKEPGTGEDEEGFAEMIGPDHEAPAKIGEKGIAQTPLRPSGRILVGDRIVDAVSEFGFIETGTSVVVVSVQGQRVGVERVPL